MRVPISSIAVIVSLACLSPVLAQEPPPPDPASTGTWVEDEDSLTGALAGGETWLKLRARYEHVDDDAFGPESDAYTLRTVLGYRTGEWRDLTGTVEFEAVTHLFDDSFNSTTNGETGRPVVADPEQSEINQAMIAWDGLENTEAWIGRRRIKLDNDRFVGNVGWRQNEQTFDSAGFEYDLGGHANLFYAYVANVNRIFGEDNPNGDERSNTHLVNVSGEVGAVGKLSGYWYVLDNDSPSALDSFSTSTVGGRLTGAQELNDLSLLYTAELATQDDTGDNPNSVDAGYMRGELGVRHELATVKLGYELLEGSGDPGDKFTTPLATLHAFNGWADKFLATPDDGLEDLFVDVSGAWREIAWKLAWHEFTADNGSSDYGTEIDASVGFDVTETVRAGLKVASYDADDFGDDTTKIWLWFSTSLL